MEHAKTRLNDDTKALQKRTSGAKEWNFIWNEYKKFDYETTIKEFDNISEKYAMQEEMGETGDECIRGTIKFLTRTRPSEKFKNLGARWRTCDKREASVKYFPKEEMRNGKQWIKGIRLPRRDVRFNNITTKNLKDWQVKVMEYYEEEPDDRTVMWIYDPKGNSGKSWLGAYMADKYDDVQLITVTKSADIIKMIDEYTKMYIFDFPRSRGDWCPFGIIEQIKNGRVANTKLKKIGRTINCAPAHVVCLSNYKPDMNKLSGDRWRIIAI